MGATFYPETSVIVYHYMARNIQEDGRSRLLRGGSLNSSLVIDTKWKIKGACYTAPLLLLYILQ
jgi:hypothetical protein